MRTARHPCLGARDVFLRAAVAAVVLALGACSGGEGDGASAKKSVPPPPIERVEGMKYYVGGPEMASDRYGRTRLSHFNGEVSAPTTRGLLIGFKLEGEKFDYRTYINGRLVSSSTGFLDDDGMLWFTERFTYDSAGKVIARQTLEYDDAAEIMISSVEHLDPGDGTVLKTIDQKIPYRPVEDDEDDSFFDDDDDEEEVEEEEEE